MCAVCDDGVAVVSVVCAVGADVGDGAAMGVVDNRCGCVGVGGAVVLVFPGDRGRCAAEAIIAQGT